MVPVILKCFSYSPKCLYLALVIIPLITMKQIGVTRSNRAVDGGFAPSVLTKNPIATLFWTMAIVLGIMSVFKAMDSLFFQFGILSSIIWNLLIVTTAVLGGYYTIDWIGEDKKTVGIVVAIVIIMVFTIAGEAIGEFVFSLISP
jgi:hypothetical protein